MRAREKKDRNQISDIGKMVPASSKHSESKVTVRRVTTRHHKQNHPQGKHHKAGSSGMLSTAFRFILSTTLA